MDCKFDEGTQEYVFRVIKVKIVSEDIFKILTFTFLSSQLIYFLYPVTRHPISVMSEKLRIFDSTLTTQ